MIYTPVDIYSVYEDRVILAGSKVGDGVYRYKGDYLIVHKDKWHVIGADSAMGVIEIGKERGLYVDRAYLGFDGEKFVPGETFEEDVSWCNLTNGKVVIQPRKIDEKIKALENEEVVIQSILRGIL